MPVFVDSIRTSKNRDRTAPSPRHQDTLRFPLHAGQGLTIGLINNMGDAAFRATERQFISLLDAASDDIPIRLKLYTLPGIPRQGIYLRHAEGSYSSVDTIGRTHLDGLIVTGREPMAADLRDEPYWDSFTSVLEWARENTYSTVWSCLAAHAAVLYMDGIGRCKSDEKCFGALKCTRAADHPLMTGVPPSFPIPHSRWNGVPEEELIARGYAVLSRTSNSGIDAFVKQVNSLFVFFQGHPEYGAYTLLREYRRDVSRYLRGESDGYPSTPSGYFDQPTADALSVLREKAVSNRNKELLASIAAVLDKTAVENTWRMTAALIYRNWLEYIRARKQSTQLDHGAGFAIASAQ
jgi:homoserine O-succinyltransferase/O-acetyltransferase